MASGYLKTKTKKPKQLLPGLASDLLRILWASISFPHNCHFPKSSLFGADTGHGNTGSCCWSSLHVVQQQDYFLSAVRVSLQLFLFF